jgi:hypothetical protein
LSKSNTTYPHHDGSEGSHDNDDINIIVIFFSSGGTASDASFLGSNIGIIIIVILHSG